MSTIDILFTSCALLYSFTPPGAADRLFAWASPGFFLGGGGRQQFEKRSINVGSNPGAQEEGGGEKMSSKSVYLEPYDRLSCIILLLKISCFIRF